VNQNDSRFWESASEFSNGELLQDLRVNRTPQVIIARDAYSALAPLNNLELSPRNFQMT